ncbi:MAG: hypothetical protein HQM11_00210 [SAR324 cluster bacterium]|nr:hypothetical protein [SAR324 cluster bacterium]
MKKTITIKEFADELIRRISEAKTIDCCKEELVKLATIAKNEIGEKKIEVNWKKD